MPLGTEISLERHMLIYYLLISQLFPDIFPFPTSQQNSLSETLQFSKVVLPVAQGNLPAFPMFLSGALGLGI